MSDWKTEAMTALARLNGEQWADKMKTTILAIVDAHLAGISEETVWELPGTCARKTYHLKWKKQPLFAEVLAKVDGLARDWKDRRALDPLGEAVHLLRLASPDAAERLIAIMRQEGDLTNSRLAAAAVLDRAGLETASKAAVDLTTKGEKLKGYAIFSPDDWDDEKETGDDDAEGD